ncbi:MAG: hypothetical protein ACKOPE_02855 [Novosphingobium sp.]
MAVSLCSAASAGEVGPIDHGDGYALYWTIGETAVREGDFWVKEQEAIVETRLWPVALYVTDKPVTGNDGSLLAPSGTQFLRVTGDRLLVCTQVKTTTGLSKSKRVCLADMDGDGTIDSSFAKGLGGTSWIAFSGRFSESKAQPVSGVTLRELSPQAMTGAPFAAFHYQRILDGGLQIPLTQEGGNMVRFHFKVGKTETESRTWVVRECREPGQPSFCTSANFPSHMSIAGLDLELLERRKEDIRMRMIQPFHGQRVRFVDTSYGYYTQLTLFSPENP